MGALLRGFAAVAAACLALSVGISRARLSGLVRTPQAGLVHLETTKERSHNRFTILPSADEGNAFTFTEFIRPGTPGGQKGYPASPIEHVHPFQVETFEVLSGAFGYFVDGKEEPVAQAGSTVTVQPGARHFFYNAGDKEGHHLNVTISLQPPGESKRFFMNLAGLSVDYGGTERIPPLQALLTFCPGSHTRCWQHLALPWPALKLIEWVVVPLARLHGYKPYYDVYNTGV